MDNLDRRSLIGLGVLASATVTAWTAAAQTSAGKELAPGVRQIDYGERDSLIPAYKKVRLRDIVISPGAQTPERDMMNDMLCHMTEGELAGNLVPHLVHRLTRCRRVPSSWQHRSRARAQVAREAHTAACRHHSRFGSFAPIDRRSPLVR
jgi:hypothetical protein